MPVPFILHERRSRWARHIRPVLTEWGVALVETRSAAEAAQVAARSACPVALVEDSSRPASALEVVDSVRAASPSALILAIGPGEAFGPAAREVGATAILPETATPPRVLGLLNFWAELASRRAATLGWAEDRRPEPEPWLALLGDSAPLPASSS